MFKAIKKKSVPEKIVTYVLDSILDNSLKENDKLPSERSLCEVLRVSRSSLREGLRILEMMEVIEKRSDGTYVKIQNGNIIGEIMDINLTVSPVNFFELIEVRNLLETKSAIFAAKNATTEDIISLEILCNDMKKNIKCIKDYALVDTDFHIKIAEATQNDIMYQIFETLRETMYEYQKNNMRTNEDVMRSFNEHLELLDAIKEGNAKKTENIMKKHLKFTQNLYEDKLNNTKG